MTWRRVIAAALWTGALAIGALLILAAANIRSPAIMYWRPWPIVLLIAAASIYIVAVWILSRSSTRILRIGVASLGMAALLVGVWREVSMILLRSAVLSTSDAELRPIGRHLIVGFDTLQGVEPLVTKAAVAGVFLAGRNARQRSTAELASDIEHLQRLRRVNSLPPLWIATDQEGGLVAALSPPLPRPPALSSLTHAGELVVDAAQGAARDLACVGVNLNFAPVVDRNYRVIAPGDGLTQISRRAISSDERVIALTARNYCDALAENGVQCTLKHFPGIGAVKEDTHRRKATLPDLNDDDLFPFHDLANVAPPWIMLSHVTIEGLDAARPASASEQVIGVLRNDWEFNGILVTDDGSMAAYSSDFAHNAVDSLRYGADLLLVSYDPDLAYQALDILVRANRTDAALAQALARSDARLRTHAPLTPACRRLALR